MPSLGSDVFGGSICLGLDCHTIFDPKDSAEAPKAPLSSGLKAQLAV